MYHYNIIIHLLTSTFSFILGPESFYVTNDLYFSNYILKQIEAYYPFKLGSIAFYNGEAAKIVADNMAFANGIDIDKTGK